MNKLIKKGLIGSSILFSLICIQSPSLAAMMQGSFDFTGFSTYCDLNNRPANLPITANVNIHKIKNDDGTEESGPGSTISFNVPDTACWTNPDPMETGWNPLPVKITSVDFGEKWQIKKINFSGLADPQTYPDGSTNGHLDGYLDFMNMTSKMTLTYQGTGATSMIEVNMMRAGTSLPKSADLKINKVSETSSGLSLLILGTLGTALTLKYNRDCRSLD